MQRIPNHSLRAGLTGLLGTIGEPATNFILNAKTPAGLPKVFAIDFDANPFNPSDTGIARSIRHCEINKESRYGTIGVRFQSQI
ncbi:MAG: hypothetical protein ACR2KU_12095 [Gammaproteobacteria bacterium]